MSRRNNACHLHATDGVDIHLLDSTDDHPLRIHPAIAGCHDGIPLDDISLTRQIHEDYPAAALSGNHRHHARGRTRNDTAHRCTRIQKELHTCGILIHFTHKAHKTRRDDDRHILLDAAVTAAVHDQRLCPSPVVAGDDRSPRQVVLFIALLERKETLQSDILRKDLAVLSLLCAKAFIFLPERIQLVPVLPHARK